MDRSDGNNDKTSEETVRTELLEAIDTAIHSMKTLMKTKATEKGSISDLIRLLQLRKELDGDQPRHISVRWIDEDEC